MKSNQEAALGWLPAYAATNATASSGFWNILLGAASRN